ncbi:MAG: hypothetical protein IJY66_05480 [Clostridia bacterium]|nr:hypothetical protein [Clostridia bacterium]
MHIKNKIGLTSFRTSTDFKWLGNSYVNILTNEYGVCLNGNKYGLRSLSNQIKQIIRKDIPTVLYDEFPGDLEEGSWSMTVKLISADAFSSQYCSNNITPLVSMKPNGEKKLEWYKNSCFVIRKEGNHGIQLVGNMQGLKSFSNHLKIISRNANLHVLYEQTMIQNTPIPLFSVHKVNCRGR